MRHFGPEEGRARSGQCRWKLPPRQRAEGKRETSVRGERRTSHFSMMIRFTFGFMLIAVTMEVSTSGSSPNCHATGPCSCEMSDGSGVIDLSPLSNGQSPNFKGIADIRRKEFTYDYDPCKPFTTGTCQNVFVCQILTQQPPSQFNLGTSFSTKYDVVKNKVQFIYKTRKPSKLRTTIVTLNCNHKADKAKLDKFEEPQSLLDHYFTTLTSKHACPSKSDAKKKLSVGSILCILLVVTIVLYLVLGIVINRYLRNKQGTDLIPNVGFWADLLPLVKDGCIFSVRKVRGRSSQYQPI